jgi:hypothetical protein
VASAGAGAKKLLQEKSGMKNTTLPDNVKAFPRVKKGSARVYGEDSGRERRRYEPRSREDWETHLREHRIGAFMTYRDMFSSSAFMVLCRKSAKAGLALWVALSQLNHEKNQVRRQTEKHTGRDPGRYKNGARICLPQNLLECYGIYSSATQTKVKRLLVEFGFLDVEQTGSLYEATTFRLSSRWRDHPNVRPQHDAKPIAERKYANSTLSNPAHPIRVRRNQNRIQKMNGAAFNQ